MRFKISRFFGFLSVCLAFGMLFSPPTYGYRFDWHLPNSLYKELSVFERNQYKKAEDLFAAKKYGQAALEFDKFTLENEDSPALVAAAFMKAYSQECNLKRYEAIKLYYELIDLFPDDLTYAPLAMYRIGVCNLANGDKVAGLKAMRALVRNKQYQKHPLVANALQMLADNARKNKEMAKAYKYLEQIYTDFYRINPGLARAARDELVRAYIKQKRFSSIEKLVARHDWKAPREDYRYYNYLYDRASHEVFSRGYSLAEKKEKGYQTDIKKFFSYWQESKPVYTKAKHLPDYLYRAFTFSVTYVRDKKVWEPICDQYILQSGGNEGTIKHVMITLINSGFIDKALKLAGKLKSDQTLRAIIVTLMNKGQLDKAVILTGKIKDKDAFYPWFFDQLMAKKQYDFAAHILEEITDPALAHWDEYRLKYALKQWKDCIDLLKNIAATDKDRAGQANWNLASIYQSKTRQYDEAIKIYTLINDPPRSVWPIADCYKAKGQMKKAAQTLTEIENFFPKFASQAAYRRGELYRHFGDTKKAIAEYRRILKVYKKSRESSLAHQRLESYGIATGGGVTE